MFSYRIQLKRIMKKLLATAVLIMATSNSVSGIFWDFSRPTDNPTQAAAGGAFLGAAGILSLD